MLRYERPEKPSDFDDKMKPYRDEVRKQIDAQEEPSFRESVWKGYKRHFSEAQYGKCGYCESYVLATDTGDVEHFRPKGKISELLAEGREQPGTSNVEGRHLEEVSARGYWWLAYEWTNWLFACDRCNVGWKRTLFPVAERQDPAPDVEDTALLLHPYGKEDPADHLAFDEFGQISATSESRMGLETIRALGLYRESLRNPRKKIAARIYQLLDQMLIQMAETGETEPELLKDILRYGAPDEPHAGMVRILFQQEIDFMTWSDLEKRCQ